VYQGFFVGCLSGYGMPADINELDLQASLMVAPAPFAAV
jgi:hypothetical protein